MKHPSEEVLYWNLKRYGSPLARCGMPGVELTLEECLAHTILLSRWSAGVAPAWPVVYARNRDKLDLRRLAELAKDLDQERALGLYLSVVCALMDDPAAEEAMEKLRRPLPERPEYFFLAPCCDRVLRMEEEKTPQLAKEWGFFMNASIGSFENCFRKFVRHRPREYSMTNDEKNSVDPFEFFRKSIARSLGQERRRARLTLEDLSLRTGIRAWRLAAVEKGLVEPSVRLVDRIVEATGRALKGKKAARSRRVSGIR